ncbi:MAG: phosphotransferase [Planctomycetota bacterium]
MPEDAPDLPQTPDRRHPRLSFDADVFAAFLGGRTIERCAPMPGGASNTNHRLTLSDGQTVVARQYTRGDPTTDANAIRLAKTAVPIPELLWHGDNAAVFAFVEGEHLRDEPDQLRDAGRTLAALTTVRFSLSGAIQPDGSAQPFAWGSPEDWLAGVLRDPQVERWLGRDRSDALRDLIQRHDLFAVDPNTGPCLVHGDYRPDNLLVRDGRVVAVLDWEFAHAGSWFMDLGNLLRHFDASAEAPLLEGLRDGGLAVPDDAVDHAKLIDLGSHLEFLTSARSDAFKATRVALIDRTLERFV